MSILAHGLRASAGNTGGVAFDGDISSLGTPTNSLALGTIRFSGVYFSNDGLHLYVSDSNPNRIRQFLLSTAWDISTASFVGEVTGYVGSLTDLFLHPDGTYVFYVNRTGTRLDRYELATPWDISSVTGSPNQAVPDYVDLGFRGLAFSSDGTKMYVGFDGADYVHQYTLTTAWTPSTLSWDSKLLIFSFTNPSGGGTLTEGNPRGIYVSPDGKYIYGCGQNLDGPIQFEMSTPFDISTATFVAYSNVVTYTPNPQGIYFSTDGKNFYSSGETANVLYQWVL